MLLTRLLGSPLSSRRRGRRISRDHDRSTRDEPPQEIRAALLDKNYGSDREDSLGRTFGPLIRLRRFSRTSISAS